MRIWKIATMIYMFKKKEYINNKVCKSAAGLIYDYLKDNNIVLSIDNVSFISNKAVGIAAIENNLVEDVILNAGILGMDKGELSDWYNRYYVTDNIADSITKRLSGNSFESYEYFDAKLLECFILSVVEEPDGVDNIRQIMQQFYKEIGIGKTGSEGRYASVMGEYYNNYDELKTAFDSYKEKTTTGGGSGGGGGTASAPSKIYNDTDRSASLETYPITIFSDLETVPWAEDAIIALAEKGVIKGKGNNLFCPDDYITREEFTVMLVNALIPNQEEARLDFSDIAAGEWYKSAVAKAFGAGIIKGESEKFFGIGKNITREDMAVMIYRAAAYVSAGISKDNAPVTFEDSEEISDYATEAVYALKKAEIINGISEELFAPKENATRAQAAKMIYKLLNIQGGI